MLSYERRLFMANKNNTNNRKAVTLLLDSKTLELLKKYAYEKIGKTNMSQAVMLMANEYEQTMHKENQ